MSILIQPATSPLRSRPELIAALEAFLQHLQESAEDGDLEGAQERVTGKYGDFEGRLYPRMGGSAAIPITVIPAPARSGAPLPCSPIVVAVVAPPAGGERVGAEADLRHGDAGSGDLA